MVALANEDYDRAALYFIQAGLEMFTAGVSIQGAAAQRAAISENVAEATLIPAQVPGKFAGASMEALSTSQRFTVDVRRIINGWGDEFGCHTCGAPTPGTITGNWVPDHIPASSLWDGIGVQRLYPQCLQCSREQGLEIIRV